MNLKEFKIKNFDLYSYPVYSYNCFKYLISKVQESLEVTGNAAEIGVWKGGTSKVIAELIKNTDKKPIANP